MTFKIAELRAGEQGGFSPRGGARELWKSKDPEIMLSGPAETGKTWSCCQKLNALLWKYPGAQGVMARKTQASMYGSVIATFKRVIGENSPVKAYGGEKPEWFDYPNGSRLWIRGLDNAQRILSSEYGIVYVNQSEELTVDDWEILRTRNTGRGSPMPYAQQIGDCNPGPPQHWILKRVGSGALKLLTTRHEDNPTLFSEQGAITEQGVRSLAVLDALTGTRYKRLRKGLWVSADGQVFETYDPTVHLIDRNDARYGLANGLPGDSPRYWSIDFGYTNPFVWQEWAADGDGRLFLLREIYMTQKTVKDHCGQIRDITKGCPKPKAVICDHDAEDRATLEQELGVSTLPAEKAVTTGIQAVEDRLRSQGDGKPRLFILRDGLVELDRSLVERHLPVCTAEEFSDYVWSTAKNGRGVKEEPVKRNDHGVDDLRYMVMYFDHSKIEPGILKWMREQTKPK